MATPEVVAHWHLLVDDFTTDVAHFYEVVEERIRERAIPDLKVERFDWREGGIFGAKRAYLRVRRDKQMYDLCAAPYGRNAFFFSSWGVVEDSGILALLARMIPVFGPILQRIFKPVTYYSLDTTYMFQESVARAVSDAIASVRAQKGLRALAPEVLPQAIRQTPVGNAAWI